MLPIASFLSAALIGWAWVATVLLAVSLGGTRHEVRPMHVPAAGCAATCVAPEADVRAVARLSASLALLSRAQ